MKLLYFAWVRERIGVSEESVELPPTVTSVTDLLDWLAKRGENYHHALSDRVAICVAVDQIHVDHVASLSGAKEVALFPPMTGG